MNEYFDNDNRIDPRLEQKINMLRKVPPRDPDAIEQGRAMYLAEVDELFSEKTVPAAWMKKETAVKKPKNQIWFLLSYPQQRLAFSSLLAILAVVLVLFSGAGATAYAAQSALPGDALYGFKTSIEQTQARLSLDAAREAQLHLSFAERRLNEIAALIANGRYENIDTATREFESNIQKAIDAMATVSAGNPEHAQALTEQIHAALTRYIEILRGMLTAVPDTVKPSVEKAILFSESEAPNQVEFTGVIESMTEDGIVIGGQLVRTNAQTEIKSALSLGMMVKVHALIGPDGQLVAIEIEPGEVENENLNMNDNVNINDNEDNLNLNENENLGNLNENENLGNENDNENEDLGNQNGNQNDNDDDDENSNANQNDNSYDNGDDDENDNGDNDNDSGGGGDNSNDNEEDNSGGSGGNDNDDDSGGGNDNGGNDNDHDD
jgi:hypothetical protein